MNRFILLTLCQLIAFHCSALATLLVDYTAAGPVSDLGSCQLEGAYLGDHIDCPGNSSISIKPGQDPSGKAALHFHRNHNFRRAEVKAKGTYAEGKTYFVGYAFQLSHVHQHLAIFQWKKDQSTADPVQNIPFNLQFTEEVPTRLSLGYTPPGTKYSPIWTSSSDFAVNTLHHIALAWDTKSSGNSIQLWLDGKSVFQKSGLDLWTGYTYPKFGIYRGEQGDHDSDNDGGNTYDSYIYRVQLSDASLDEVKAASGL